MEELYSGHGWRITKDLYALESGEKKEKVRVHRCDAVHILAFTEEGKLLMLKEFRPIYGTHIWMLPSGKADKEMDLLEAAHRELREEAGFDAKSMEYFGSCNSTESIEITNHLYIAKDLFESPLPQDEDENMEVHELSIEEAIRAVETSAKVHTVSIYGLLKYAREHNKS